MGHHIIRRRRQDVFTTYQHHVTYFRKLQLPFSLFHLKDTFAWFSVWCSPVLYGTVHYCMVQYSIVWYSRVLYGTVHYCMVQYSIVWYSTVLYGTVEQCMVQYSIVGYSTLLYGTVQYCMVLSGLIVVSMRSQHVQKSI